MLTKLKRRYLYCFAATMASILETGARLLEWICHGVFRGPIRDTSGGYSDFSTNVHTPTLADADVTDPGNSDAAQEPKILKYDVFLNHRGPDVKGTFVAHLNDALREAGFHPFLDGESLTKGDPSSKSIEEALSGACVHVAVFSKGYAESEYCLNELCAMLARKKADKSVIILPVFYNVEPAHLRRPDNGPFAEGFRKHLSCGRRVERWKDALREVADLTGFRLADVNGNESQLKRQIVNAVKRALPVERLLQAATFSVGLTESVSEVVGKLDKMGDAVRLLGIAGMGGIGKTTIAKEVYNHFAKRRTFEKQSFLDNVRGSKMLDLQSQLVEDLLQEKLESAADFQMLFSRLLGRKVLIVIDGIDKIKQFQDLIPDIKKLAPRSRVVVTSSERNKLHYIMKGARSDLYEVQQLNSEDSLQLFNWHAFRNVIAESQFHLLAKEVADACKGHPLALEVIGARLCGKEDEELWKEAAKAPVANTDDIRKKLRISYDCLSKMSDKLMFLDISCFMIGTHKARAMQIWESCREFCVGSCGSSTAPYMSLQTLIDKSLVKLDRDERLTMHDLLRDVGRNVVDEQSLICGERSHLWDPDTAGRVLRKDEGSKKVRGFSMAGLDTCAAWDADRYARMTELHLLLLDGCRLEGDFGKLSKELRWLQWRAFSLEELPSELCLVNVAVLDLTDSTKLIRVWPEDQIQLPSFLGSLILKNCTALEEFPESIGTLTRLVTLDVQGCTKLRILPSNVGQLEKLQHMSLSGCAELESLPDSIVKLSNLKQIQMNNCSKLTDLPLAFGELRSLVEFSAEEASLSHLPNSFSQLSNLEKLLLHKCRLRELPLSVSGLVKLRVLHMGRTEVEKLPEDFGELSSLTELHLDDCENLRTLPESFGNLTALHDATMQHNRNLIMLPQSFGGLKSLWKLYLNGSIREGGLPPNFGQLAVLTVLLLSYNDMVKLPKSFKDLKSLFFLDLHHCPKLVNIQALPCESLQYLDLGNCPKLAEIPCLGKLTKLTSLTLCNCTSLTRLDGLESLNSLEEINVTGCIMLRSAQGLNHNRALKMCGLSGSLISMAYDSGTWSEREPALQVVSYYGQSLGFVNDGLAQKLSHKESANELCLEMTVSRLEEIVAVIFCFVAHDQGWADDERDHDKYNSNCFMEARIVREGAEEPNVSKLFALRTADWRDQVYVCTLRRQHLFVEALQHGDKICVYARSFYPGWAISVKQGAVCLVHGEDHQIDTNSEVDQAGVKENLVQLVMADNLD